MNWPLFSRLPTTKDVEAIKVSDPGGGLSNLILDRFLEFVKEKNLSLYPAQEEAILEIFDGKNVILNTPTGSGKSLVATAMHFYSLARGRRSVYTSPIKALVNEKFFSLCKEFGPEQVGMVTGDASVNPRAPILCCTAEILAVDALREGATVEFQDIIMDEFHYYSDRERGVSWQLPLLTLTYSRFLLMSATMGDCERFEKILTKLNDLPTTTVQSNDRPVPLEFSYSENPLHETVSTLVTNGRAPIYLVSFTQRECVEEAQNFMSIDLCNKQEKKTIQENLVGFRFSSPYGKELQKFIKHGMGVHHGGLLPKYRMLVERLAQKGLLKIIFGTDTLGVGVNIPIRTVLFTKLCKYDGTKTSILSVRDFKQISGRAGRKGFDDRGTVVVQAPEHVIENRKEEMKAAGDPKKLRKIVKKKPPEKGFILWTKDTFQKLIESPSEPLVSKFQINHAMILNVLSRPNEEGCEALRKIIRDSHETAQSKNQLRKRAFQLFRSLVDRKIVEFKPLRVNADLQEDFSLNHALSLFLVDTLQQLDRDSETYALDVLTLAESILENPDLILRKQLDALKTLKMQELKQQGMEYEERIEELEKLEHPKPNRDFIYSQFNEFTDKHPWIEKENIRPKSVAREIFEGFYSFSEYIREYDLQRAEGILLRYLSDVYKVMVQNVPQSSQDDKIAEIIIYIGGIIKDIDSSLIDEWERLKINPMGLLSKQTEGNPDKDSSTEKSISVSLKTLRIMIRNEVFQFLKLVSYEKFDEAVESLTKISFDSDQKVEEQVVGHQWADTLRLNLTSYRNLGYDSIRTDPSARDGSHLSINEEGNLWQITQGVLDSEGATDWVFRFEMDLTKSKAMGRPSLAFLSFDEL